MDEAPQTNENSYISHLVCAFLVIVLIVISLVLVIPILGNIMVHADEGQFYGNAWSIMSGKQLVNFLHVAVTEYALTGFFLIINMLVPSGVNFPKNPSLVTYFYGRVFGAILYFATFLLVCFVLQKGEKRIRPRTVFFSILYFGSVGLFERFFRVNSDSMSIFVVLNYLLLSLWLHRKRARTWEFLILDTSFVFLTSFTNLKTLYLSLPLLAINTLIAFWFYDRERDYEGTTRLPRIYRLGVHVAVLLAGCILLWVFLLPKPVDYNEFWPAIKNTTVMSTRYDFVYPNQAGNSGLIYFYDFFVEYLGLSQALAIAIFIVMTGLALGRRNLIIGLLQSAKKQLGLGAIKEGRLYESTELLVLIMFLSFYVGVSVTVIHWSRWGAPLGVFGIILLSSVLERVFYLLKSKVNLRNSKYLLSFLVLFLLAWSMRVALFVDIVNSGFPRVDGQRLTVKNIESFYKEKNIPSADGPKVAAWFQGYTPNAGSITLEKLFDPDHRNVKYVFWPQWIMGPLYTDRSVDKTTHFQRAFLEKYAKSIIYRFPTLLSYYTHYTKLFAWKYLGITYTPELLALIEPQYAVVEFKDLPPAMSLDYTVSANGLSYDYAPDSPIFNIKNLPENYTFPPCSGNPEVVVANTGVGPEPANPWTPEKIAGLHCHTLWFSVFPHGLFKIKIEGLPADPGNAQKVYSAYPYKWDPIAKTATFNFKDSFAAVDLGVATKEKNLPNLKFLVSYDLLPK